MANINYAFKEVSCKIVYYGPGLCGKTTNLQVIHSTIPPKFRGELISLATEQDRTLFFDFLPLDLGEVKGFKTKFQLYTVPGQVYYSATRRLVLKGADGVVFVADSAADRMKENCESLVDFRENLESYGLSPDTIPWVVQFNKRDLPNTVPREEMEALLNPDRVPSFEAVASQGIGVKETLKGIAALVLRRLSEATEGGPRLGSSLERKAAAAATETASARSQKVSLTASAAAPAPTVPVPPTTAAAAVSAPPPAPAASAPGFSRTSSEVPDLHVLQRCDLHWAGLRIGTAVVEISRRASSERKGLYVLTSESTTLGMFRSGWECALQWGGEEAKVVEQHNVSFYRFSEVPTEGGKERSVRAWVKNAFDKACYVSYRGAGGMIRLMPAGRKWIG